METQFINLCSDGDLLGAQKYLQLHPNINISAKNERVFRTACYNRYLNIAQWLLHVSKEREQDINISAVDHCAFRFACMDGHLHGYLHVAQWLQSLNPYLYVINYDENGKYKDYYIRSKEEANWEKRKYLLYIASDCKEDNLLYRLPYDVSKMVIGYV